MSYQAEKFHAARRALMLPHSRGEAESISDAFHEISLALHRFDDSKMADHYRTQLRMLREHMDTTGLKDPMEQGLWRVKAETFTVDQQYEVSRIVDELAWYFDNEDDMAA